MPNSSHEATFDALFAEHHPAVQRYCLRRAGVDEANDAAAEVFLVAWRRIEEVPVGRELPWLYGIARNVVRNAHRSRTRRRRLLGRLGGLGRNASPGPETQLVRHHEDEALHVALAALRPTDQEILRLKTWEELSNREIAAAVGASVRAVDMRISRARKRLAEAYEKTQGPQQPVVNRPRFAEEGGER